MSCEISIIIPVFNSEKYLQRCLESIKNQTFKEYEVILVNDGSTDKSGEIAEEYAKLHSETFRFVSQENMGLSEARNTGLRYAKGKYVCFVDSDDYVETAYLEELYRCAQKDDADLVFCAFQSVDEQGKVLKEVYESGFESGRVYTIEERKDLLLTQNAAWNKLYKKDIIDKHSLTFTAGAWYEDLRFVKKYMLYATKFVYCDRILLNYLIRKGSIMNSMGSKRNVEIVEAIDEVISFYKQLDMYEIYINELEFLAIEHMYIAALVRLIRAGEKEQCRIIEQEFLLRFPKHKNNKYIKQLGMRRRIIYDLLNLKLYALIKILFKNR